MDRLNQMQEGCVEAGWDPPARISPRIRASAVKSSWPIKVGV
jgi:hypothetical protein